MVKINQWAGLLKDRLLAEFGDRLVYVGLQGSYCRGEADEESDIDIMVVLDTLAASDLNRYKAIIAGMDEAEKACGFIGGRKELAHWPKHEIFLLIQETKDLYGCLRELVPTYERTDIAAFVQINTANLYHALCHGYLYAGTDTLQAHLKNCYKAVFYILQNQHYLDTGVYAATKQALLGRLDGADYAVLKTAVRLRAGEPVDPNEEFTRLLCWCQMLLSR